ncbi:WbqC family protein [Streptomyces sp. NPDC057638]|uniref:WbqC family protein n=1 Tax=Streptomyces sp. NPDC057638 TaxID=3346190 RepID=UPI0036B16B6C
MIYIEQPPFLPWLGFCEALIGCTTVALYDDVAYTQGGWQNRNRIKTADGTPFLTVPVHRATGRLIRDTPIADAFDPARMLKAIRVAYARAPYTGEALEVIAPPLSGGYRWLADLNLTLITAIATALGARARLVPTSTLPLTPTERDDGRSTRLAAICDRAGEKTLWAGEGTRTYLDTAHLTARGIDVVWNEFPSRHPRYAQTWPKAGFVPGLSVVDAACAIGWPGTAALLTAGFTAHQTTGACS